MDFDDKPPERDHVAEANQAFETMFAVWFGVTLLAVAWCVADARAALGI